MPGTSVGSGGSGSGSNSSSIELKINQKRKHFIALFNEFEEYHFSILLVLVFASTI